MKKVSSILNKGLFFVILITLVLYLFLVCITGAHHQTLSFFSGILIIPLAIWLTRNKKSDFLNNKKKVIIFLIISSLLIKTIVSLLYYPKLVADYGTFFNQASVYSQSYHTTFNNLYIGLFNHVFGYSFVLSILFYIFGSRIIVAVLFNIVLSVISTVLIYLIGEKCFDKKIGYLSSILWIICPSQSLWNSFVLSEPLYTCILLLIVYLLISNADIVSNKKSIGLGILVGILLAIFNMVRPIGIIVLFAVFLWMFIISKQGKFITKLLLFGIITITYLVCKQGINYLIEDRNSVKLGGFSWYNINVGLNYKSYGSWNEEDWERVLGNVSKYSEQGEKNPALKAQSEEKKIISKKIEGIKKPFEFFYKKSYTFIGSDSGVVDHLSDCSAFSDSRQRTTLSFICNVFYYFLLTTSLIGSIIYFIKEKSSKNKNIVLILLYGLGLACGHFIAEVQPRYHYSFIILLVFMSSYCIYNLNIKFKGVKK